MIKIYLGALLLLAFNFAAIVQAVSDEDIKNCYIGKDGENENEKVGSSCLEVLKKIMDQIKMKDDENYQAHLAAQIETIIVAIQDEKQMAPGAIQNAKLKAIKKAIEEFKNFLNPETLEELNKFYANKGNVEEMHHQIEENDPETHNVEKELHAAADHIQEAGNVIADAQEKMNKADDQLSAAVDDKIEANKAKKKYEEQLAAAKKKLQAIQDARKAAKEQAEKEKEFQDKQQQENRDYIKAKEMDAEQENKDDDAEKKVHEMTEAEKQAHTQKLVEEALKHFQDRSLNMQHLMKQWFKQICDMREENVNLKNKLITRLKGEKEEYILWKKKAELLEKMKDNIDHEDVKHIEPEMVAKLEQLIKKDTETIAKLEASIIKIDTTLDKKSEQAKVENHVLDEYNHDIVKDDIKDFTCPKKGAEDSP